MYHDTSYWSCDKCKLPIKEWRDKISLADQYKDEIPSKHLCRGCYKKFEKWLEETDEKPVENSSPVGHAQQSSTCGCTGGGRVGFWRGLYDLWKETFRSN